MLETIKTISGKLHLRCFTWAEVQYLHNSMSFVVDVFVTQTFDCEKIQHTSHLLLTKEASCLTLRTTCSVQARFVVHTYARSAYTSLKLLLNCFPMLELLHLPILWCGRREQHYSLHIVIVDCSTGWKHNKRTDPKPKFYMAMNSSRISIYQINSRANPLLFRCKWSKVINNTYPVT